MNDHARSFMDSSSESESQLRLPGKKNKAMLSNRSVGPNKTIDLFDNFKSPTKGGKGGESPSKATEAIVKSLKFNLAEVEQKLADAKMQALRVPALLEENALFKEGKEKAVTEMDEMRQAYYKDLMVYKSNSLGKVKKENNSIMAKDDFIDVNFFDQVSGWDAQTTAMINAKIDDVKSRAENRMARLIAKNEQLG
jgi:hypothetical protein